MDLKEMKHLTTSTGIKLHAKSEKNKSDAQEMYAILYSEEERSSETNLEHKISTKEIAKPIFSEVTTLYWIQTWRAFEFN